MTKLVVSKKINKRVRIPDIVKCETFATKPYVDALYLI